MLNLAEYRKKPKMLADFLPWAALVAPGVVLNKDGSFQRTARFRGPDLDSATPAELVGTTARLNNALRRLGSSWAIFVEANRLPARHYPQSLFPDVVSTLVDVERREVRPGERIGLLFARAFAPLIPRRYRAVKADAIAQALLTGALRDDAGECLVESEALQS